MNKVHLIGNLTRNPELRYTKNNTPVASYTIAINTRYGEKQETDFINITSWGKSGEFVNKYFKKGQAIAISGRLKNNNYQDSNGVTHYGIEVITEDIEFVGHKKEDKQNDIKPQEGFIPNFDMSDYEDLPFL